MKIGLTVVWKNVRNGVGSGIEFSKQGRRTRMMYTNPLKLNVQR